MINKILGRRDQMCPWEYNKSLYSSYERQRVSGPNRNADPTVTKEEVDNEAPKKLVTGTNADLRKLPIKEARQMCREFGLLEEEISQLERWVGIRAGRNCGLRVADCVNCGVFCNCELRIAFADF
uniref:Uncharacterized protein n=1 Tax=Meloidogyne incognita TaxID=6306 RepID=A0A914KT96_MELIC